ncbi:hypothetical protein ACHAWF_008695 [Thalassiosira exigua]
MDEPTSTSSARTSGGDALVVDALARMLNHAPDLLEFADLGNLASCSSSLRAVVGDTAFRGAFDRASKAYRAGHKPYPSSPSCRGICWSGYCQFVAWTAMRKEVGSGDSLSCLTDPDPKVLESVGYARAAGCLLSKTCYHCGIMASLVNPVTLTRTCSRCATGKNQQSQHALILQSKAMQVFYLDEGDFESLPKATIPFRRKLNGSAFSSVVLSMPSVVEAAYAKYGGRDGFDAMRTARLASRPIRRNPTRSGVDNPFKRNKVDDDLDLKSIRCRNMEALPIGTIEIETGDPVWVRCRNSMALPVGLRETYSGDPVWVCRRSVQCAQWIYDRPRAGCRARCGVKGNPTQIYWHERVAHNINLHSSGIQRYLWSQSIHPRCTYLETEEAKELVMGARVAGAKSKYRRGRGEEFGAENLQVWHYNFDFGGCKKVDMELRRHTTDMVMDSVSKYSFGMYAQLEEKKPPTRLFGTLTDQWNEAVGILEASPAVFDELVDALGLAETTPSQLMVSLFASLDFEFLQFLQFGGNTTNSPVLSEAYSIMKSSRG